MWMMVLGFLLLVGGYYLFAQYAPQWHQVQSLLGQLASGLSHEARLQIDAVKVYYFASIAAMGVGGFFIVLGFLESILAGLQGREKRK